MKGILQMRFEVGNNKGERIWHCSTHVLDQFRTRNKFLKTALNREVRRTLLNMMNKAVLVTYDLEQNSDIYNYGSWIFVCKESTIVTVYEKKGSRWEDYIHD
jgi:hypothetical protein